MRSSPSTFYSRSTNISCWGVARTSRPVPLASESFGVVGAPLSAPEMHGQAPERPETMHMAMAAKDGARYLPRLACRSLTERREERGRKIGSGPVAPISRLIGGVGIGVRLDRLAIEMPRRVAEHRNHYRKAKEERYRSKHQ